MVNSSQCLFDPLDLFLQVSKSSSLAFLFIILYYFILFLVHILIIIQNLLKLMPPKSNNNKNKKSSSPPTVPEQLNAALAKCLVNSQAFRVHGAQTGYRNKICYSLVNLDDEHSTLPTSDQAMPLLNEIAIYVHQLCKNCCKEQHVYSSASSSASSNNDNTNNKMQLEWKDFFVEVTVKSTRQDEVMLKLAVTHDLSQEFLSSSEQQSSFSNRFAQQVTQKFPMVRCVMLHIAPPGMKKGTKQAEDADQDEAVEQICGTNNTAAVSQSRYVPIFENRTSLIDLTSNRVPLQISMDSFTEVNPKMEDEMCKAALEFLKIPANVANPAKTDLSSRHNRCALFMGRDCNVQYLTLKYFYGDHAMLTTPCPRALRDACAMDLPNFCCVSKDKLGEAVFNHALLDTAKKYAEREKKHVQAKHSANDDDDNKNNNNTNEDENDGLISRWDFIVTAGRHGLLPSLSQEMIKPHVIRLVNNFIYTSCNVDSLTRDLHVFRQAFVIAGVRSFDFFPGTRYTMTMIHFVPRVKYYEQKSSCGDANNILTTHLEERSKTRNLLVLPIGLPCVGKSSCSKALKEEIEKEPKLTDEEKSIDITKVKRSLRREREMMNVHLFERDQEFHDVRSVEGKSLNATKQEVHRRLVDFLSTMIKNDTSEQHDDAAANSSDERINNNNDDDDAGNIFILDSSNGSIDQRKEYRNMWQRTKKNRSSFFNPVIEIYLDPSSVSSSASIDLLLERSLQRQNHPAFPSDSREEARKKIEAISKAIQPPLELSSDQSSSFVVRCAEHDASSWKTTFEQFAWICFLGYFTVTEEDDGDENNNKNQQASIAKKILSEVPKVDLAF